MYTGNKIRPKETLPISDSYNQVKTIDYVKNSQLRGSEESKIECARRHFKAISDNDYIYDVAKDYKSLYDIVTK